MAEVDEASEPHAATWDAGWPQTLDEFERLVETFQDRLVRYAFRRLGTVQDAEDVAQDVFVRAYADRSRHKGVVNVNAYLFRMASNLCTDWQRKQRRRNPLLAEAEVMHVPATDRDVAEEAAAEEDLRRIETLLREIPSPQAEVVQLHVLDGLRLREIAQVIGRPVGTVKSRLRYGLDKLRKIVLDEPEVF
ncbi:RNA polymerase sigma factor [Planctomycetota bacterium]